MATSLGGYAAEALAILEREAPQQYATIAELFGAYPARCEFSGESFEIHGNAGRAEVRRERSERHSVTLASSGEAIVRLLDGTAMLERLLATEEVWIAGEGEALMALSAISQAAISGGLRSLAMHELFERFRASVAENHHTSREVN